MAIKKVQVARLKNGIPIYFQPDRSSHVVSIVVRAGALNDPSDFIGRAHVFEHVAANSTRDYSSPEITKMLRTYSAHYWREAGIYTTLASTSYGCGLMRRRDYILNLFPLFTQMVKYPNLNADALKEIIEIERGAVLCEWAFHGEDDVGDRTMRKLLKLIYPGNPVSNWSACDPVQLMKPGVLANLQRYHKEYYVSSNIAVIVLGPDRKKAMYMAASAFGDMPAKAAPELPQSGFDKYPRLNDRILNEFTYGDATNKTFHLLLGFPTEPYGSTYDDALDILAELLETHIEHVMRDLSPSYGLGTYHPKVWTERTKLHGILYVWIPTISLEGAKRAEQVVVEEIRKIHKGHFLDLAIGAALDKATMTPTRQAARKILKRMGRSPTAIIRRPIIDEYTDAFVNSPQVLSELITDDFANGVESPDHLNDFKNRIRKVKKSNIIDAALRFLDPLRYGVVLAKPINPLDLNQLQQATK